MIIWSVATFTPQHRTHRFWQTSGVCLRVFLCSFKCVFSWQPLAGAFWACVPTAVWWVPDYKQFPWWYNPYMGLPECLHQWPVRGAIALTDIHVRLQIAGTLVDQSFQQFTSSLFHYALWFFWGVLVDKIHWSHKIIVSKITLFSIVQYQFVYIVVVIIVAIYFVVLKFYFKRMKNICVYKLKVFFSITLCNFYSY